MVALYTIDGPGFGGIFRIIQKTEKCVFIGVIIFHLQPVDCVKLVMLVVCRELQPEGTNSFLCFSGFTIGLLFKLYHRKEKSVPIRLIALYRIICLP